jgi:hypothetical protein
MPKRYEPAGRPGLRFADFRYDWAVIPEEVVRALTAVAAQAGVEVRVERFHLTLAGSGGLCRIEGQHVILVDAKLGVLEQAGIIGEALAQVDLSDIDIPGPIGAYIRTGHGEVHPLMRLRPLARVR